VKGKVHLTMTMIFRLANVDKSKIPDKEKINKLYEKAKEKG